MGKMKATHRAQDRGGQMIGAGDCWLALKATQSISVVSERKRKQQLRHGSRGSAKRGRGQTGWKRRVGVLSRIWLLAVGGVGESRQAENNAACRHKRFLRRARHSWCYPQSTHPRETASLTGAGRISGLLGVSQQQTCPLRIPKLFHVTL